MKNVNRKFLFSTIFVIGLVLASFNVNADPTVDDVTTTPESPTPLSTFTVIATITGDNILSVNVTISECTDGPPEQCFVPHLNIPMTLNIDGKYEAEVTLTGTQSSIDHVQYEFAINDNGTEYSVGELRTSLNTQTSNGGGGDSDSPGFELVIILFAVIIGIILYRKKR
jgi:hypothetical protein